MIRNAQPPNTITIRTINTPPPQKQSQTLLTKAHFASPTGNPHNRFSCGATPLKLTQNVTFTVTNASRTHLHPFLQFYHRIFDKTAGEKPTTRKCPSNWPRFFCFTCQTYAPPIAQHANYQTWRMRRHFDLQRKNANGHKISRKPHRKLAATLFCN